VEHEEQSERLEHEADGLEHESEKVGRHIEEARRDWEAKEQDSSVPGAQPESGDDEESVPGVETNPERVREQGGP
jgi:hypothetical protein